MLIILWNSLTLFLRNKGLLRIVGAEELVTGLALNGRDTYPLRANKERRKTHLFLETSVLQALCCLSFLEEKRESLRMPWPLLSQRFSRGCIESAVYSCRLRNIFLCIIPRTLLHLTLSKDIGWFLWAHLYLKFSLNLKVLETFMKMIDVSCLTGSISSQEPPWQIKPVQFESSLHLC